MSRLPSTLRSPKSRMIWRSNDGMAETGSHLQLRKLYAPASASIVSPIISLPLSGRIREPKRIEHSSLEGIQQPSIPFRRSGVFGFYLPSSVSAPLAVPRATVAVPCATVLAADMVPRTAVAVPWTVERATLCAVWTAPHPARTQVATQSTKKVRISPLLTN